MKCLATPKTQIISMLKPNASALLMLTLIRVRLLHECYAARTLNRILTKWEEHNSLGRSSVNQSPPPMFFALFNVEGLNSRILEVTELVNKIGAAFIVCNEVGKLWYKCHLPDFNLFYEKGTNKNGGVVIAVGKHLKASKVETNMPNTLIIDIFGLNEPVRVIGVYWPESQKRDTNEISQFITGNTVIAEDFNVTVSAWGSAKMDKRGEIVEAWSSNNNLEYTQGTKNSSKRSGRNIDFTFANFPGLTGETLDFESSDHKPIVYRSEVIYYETSTKFEIVKWRIFELVLCVLQDYWSTQHSVMEAIEWYKYYIRFLAALKTRLMVRMDKDRWGPALPKDILDKLKIVRKLKNRYSKNHREENTVLLRFESMVFLISN